MLEFSGSYFDGKTSRAHAVHVIFDGSKLSLAGNDFTIDAPIERVEIEPVLGNTRRVLNLKPGRLETADLEAIAQLEELIGRNRGMTLVNRLERRWGFVLLSFVATLAVIVGAVIYGIPWLAGVAARSTPVSVLEPLTKQTRDILEAQYLKPSRLELSNRVRVERIFNEVTQEVAKREGSAGVYRFELLLRSSPALGANALALPSGTVIATDDFIKLTKSDDEIRGVFAHEVGHVVRRHALSQLYQGVGVFALASLVVGDFAGVTSIAASLPAILIQSGYSRQAEADADGVAARYLIERGVGTKPMRDILQRLEAKSRGGDVPSLLRTHPATLERIEELKRLEMKR
jgi:Zn-dependent protease with chaperone function